MIRSLKCFSKEWCWEGKILIQADGNFEGIIEESDKNIYLYGRLNFIKDDMCFFVVIPENQPYHIYGYHVFRMSNSNHYSGVYTVINENCPELCDVIVDELLDQKLISSQTEELQYILEHHKNTLEERYNNAIVGMANQEDVDKRKQKLIRQGSISYYL